MLLFCSIVQSVSLRRITISSNKSVLLRNIYLFRYFVLLFDGTLLRLFLAINSFLLYLSYIYYVSRSYVLNFRLMEHAINPKDGALYFWWNLTLSSVED